MNEQLLIFITTLGSFVNLNLFISESKYQIFYINLLEKLFFLILGKLQHYPPKADLCRTIDFPFGCDFLEERGRVQITSTRILTLLSSDNPCIPTRIFSYTQPKKRQVLRLIPNPTQENLNLTFCGRRSIRTQQMFVTKLHLYLIQTHFLF